MDAEFHSWQGKFEIATEEYDEAINLAHEARSKSEEGLACGKSDVHSCAPANNAFAASLAF